MVNAFKGTWRSFSLVVLLGMVACGTGGCAEINAIKEQLAAHDQQFQDITDRQRTMDAHLVGMGAQDKALQRQLAECKAAAAGDRRAMDEDREALKDRLSKATERVVLLERETEHLAAELETTRSDLAQAVKVVEAYYGFSLRVYADIERLRGDLAHTADTQNQCINEARAAFIAALECELNTLRQRAGAVAAAVERLKTDMPVPPEGKALGRPMPPADAAAVGTDMTAEETSHDTE